MHDYNKRTYYLVTYLPENKSWLDCTNLDPGEKIEIAVKYWTYLDTLGPKSGRYKYEILEEGSIVSAQTIVNSLQRLNSTYWSDTEHRRRVQEILQFAKED
jgi:hypothetical protein